jgi:hypothetical protein
LSPPEPQLTLHTGKTPRIGQRSASTRLQSSRLGARVKNNYISVDAMLTERPGNWRLTQCANCTYHKPPTRRLYLKTRILRRRGVYPKSFAPKKPRRPLPRTGLQHPMRTRMQTTHPRRRSPRQSPKHAAHGPQPAVSAGWPIVLGVLACARCRRCGSTITTGIFSPPASCVEETARGACACVPEAEFLSSMAGILISSVARFLSNNFHLNEYSPIF